jgi:C4-dicarboxylate transporter, DctM subunit
MTDVIIYSCIYVGVLILLMLAGLHIAVVMFLIGVVSGLIFLGPNLVLSFGELAWTTSNSFILVAVPLFILLGEILLRSGISDRMYNAFAVWLNRVPGGLLHTNIASCAMFAATSGSTIATAATIGTVALPAFETRRYNEPLVLGSLAAGGTLGILIPPSINMVIYGAMTDTSIGQLFVAGIVPGVVLALMFMGLILGAALIWPSIEGAREPVTPVRVKLRTLVDLIPPASIFVVIMGSLYTGLATATEAAALGVVAALFLAAINGRLSIVMLHTAFKSTVRTTSMVMLIILGAFFLNFVLSLVGIPQAISNWVKGLGVSAMTTLWVLLIMYAILGCFMESLSMMITTIPIVTPLVVALGVDPVWFGIFLIVLTELALITPPVGMNLFVIQGIRPPGRNQNDVIIGALPFAAVMLVMIVVLMYFPDIALWLPRKLYQ